MEAQVKAALAISDYRQASQLLKQWQASDAQNPLLRFYAAQLQEHTNRLDAAEKHYTKLLQQSPHRKIISQARAGIERIRQIQAAQKQAAIEKARSVSGADQTAILAIAAPTETHRPEVIRRVAKVFDLDPYTARMKVPNSGFRIYRVGPWGDLSYFQQQLAADSASEIAPAFCVKVNDIKALQAYQVMHFEALSPQPTVICQNVEKQLGKISFNWSEVAGQIRGQLPIFEQVIDLGSRGRLVHKEKVQDYVQILDLHLPGREIVLRMCDRFYQYQKGISLSANKEINSRIQWNQLLDQIGQVAPTAGSHSGNDFNRFSKSALEFVNLLPAISPNIGIDRCAPSGWDIAYHLYSSLHYFQKAT